LKITPQKNTQSHHVKNKMTLAIKKQPFPNKKPPFPNQKPQFPVKKRPKSIKKALFRTKNPLKTHLVRALKHEAEGVAAIVGLERHLK
jgi:hypothetical protein